MNDPDPPPLRPPESPRDSGEERTLTLRVPREVDRLVVLGDPHGDVLGLEEAIAREARPTTAIASAGDNIGYTDALLGSHLVGMLAARHIPSVRGNHEAWCDEGRLFLGHPGGPLTLTPEARAWVEALPHRIHVQSDLLPGLRIVVVHTLPGWDYVNVLNAERLLDVEEADVVLCGHTHRPSIYTVRRGKKTAVRRLDARKSASVTVKLDPGARYVLDAGSLGRPTVAGVGPAIEHGSYAALDLTNRRAELCPIDKRPRLQALMEQMMLVAMQQQQQQQQLPRGSMATPTVSPAGDPPASGDQPTTSP